MGRGQKLSFSNSKPSLAPASPPPTTAQRRRHSPPHRRCSRSRAPPPPTQQVGAPPLPPSSHIRMSLRLFNFFPFLYYCLLLHLLHRRQPKFVVSSKRFSNSSHVQHPSSYSIHSGPHPLLSPVPTGLPPFGAPPVRRCRREERPRYRPSGLLAAMGTTTAPSSPGRPARGSSTPPARASSISAPPRHRCSPPAPPRPALHRCRPASAPRLDSGSLSRLRFGSRRESDPFVGLGCCRSVFQVLLPILSLGLLLEIV